MHELTVLFLPFLVSGMLYSGFNHAIVKTDQNTATEIEMKTEAEANTDGTNGSEADRQDALQYIMNTNPEDAEDPLTQIPLETADYYKDFEYSEDIVLSGIFETNTYYFKLPDYWDSQYAYAQIEAELSQLIQDVPASLTFMVNNVPVATYKMDYSNGKSQTFYVEIPMDLLDTGYNTFDITGYVRIYDEEGCIDDFSGANWVSIRKSSFIQVGYNVKPHENKISYYPYPFMSTMNETGDATSVAISDFCEEAELEAALMIRADLGNETDLEDQLSLVRISDVSDQIQNLILVSMYDNLSDEYRELLEDARKEGDLSKQSLVKFLLDEEGRPLLIITSENEECLKEAAIMLLDEDRVSQEKSDQAFVSEGVAQELIEKSKSSDMEPGRYTLDALMDSGLSFVGPFHQEGDIYLPFSGGYVLADSGKIVLKFRYSENLDFTRSMITVYWGDIPVASKKLTKANAAADELSFTMPEDAVGTYAGKITIAFDLELPDLFCTPRMDEMPWAYVTDDSTFYLPVGAGTNYSLSQRPYPFEISSEFNDLCVVIPDEISPVELDTLGSMISLYGESLSPYGSIQVARAGSLSEEDKAHNLIVIGNYADNSFFQELNDQLYFQYNKDGSAFQSNDLLILSDEYASELVTLQLLYSPYIEDRAILAVAAVDDQGMKNLREFVSDDTNVWTLENDTALIDSDLEIKTFEMAEEREEKKQPILKTVLESNEETAIFTIVSTAVMLLFLLAAILILIRAYWRNKK